MCGKREWRIGYRSVYNPLTIMFLLLTSQRPKDAGQCPSLGRLCRFLDSESSIACCYQAIFLLVYNIEYRQVSNSIVFRYDSEGSDVVFPVCKIVVLRNGTLCMSSANVITFVC